MKSKFKKSCWEEKENFNSRKFQQNILRIFDPRNFLHRLGDKTLILARLVFKDLYWIRMRSEEWVLEWRNLN
jgi:hypothetical protein